MPLYVFNSVRGTISESAKSKIAEDVTDIHCDITGDSDISVHVFFFEDAPQFPVCGKSVFLFGSIRAGQTRCQKRALVDRLRHAIHMHAAIPASDILVDMTDIPDGWVVEGAEGFVEARDIRALRSMHAPE